MNKLSEETSIWLTEYMSLKQGDSFGVETLMNEAVKKGWDCFNFMAMERGDDDIPLRWVVVIDTEWDPEPPLYDHDKFSHQEVIGTGLTKLHCLINALEQAAKSLK